MAIQSDEGQSLLASIPESERLRTAHVVTPDGRVHSGGDAVPVVADVLPHGTPVALVARLLKIPVGLGYRAVAGNRTTLSRFVSSGRKAQADALLQRRERDDR